MATAKKETLAQKKARVEKEENAAKVEEQIEVRLKKRDRKKRKGPLTSTSNAVVELADGIAETAQSFRRIAKISNTLLKSLEIEVYQDAVEDLEDRGLTRTEAIAAFDSV